MQEDFSPWEQIQYSETLIPGMELVTTARHGGIQVTREAAMLLSPAARKCGFREGGYLWFEEDCQEPVVLRELMDKKLWSPPSHVKDPDAFERDIDRNIQQYNPAYWQARERARSRPPRKPARSGPGR